MNSKPASHLKCVKFNSYSGRDIFQFDDGSVWIRLEGADEKFWSCTWQPETTNIPIGIVLTEKNSAFDAAVEAAAKNMNRVKELEAELKLWKQAANSGYIECSEAHIHDPDDLVGRIDEFERTIKLRSEEVPPLAINRLMATIFNFFESESKNEALRPENRRLAKAITAEITRYWGTPKVQPYEIL